METPTILVKMNTMIHRSSMAATVLIIINSNNKTQRQMGIITENRIMEKNRRINMETRRIVRNIKDNRNITRIRITMENQSMVEKCILIMAESRILIMLEKCILIMESRMLSMESHMLSMVMKSILIIAQTNIRTITEK